MVKLIAACFLTHSVDTKACTYTLIHLNSVQFVHLPLCYVLAFILLQLSRAIPSFDYLTDFEISRAGFYRLDTQLTSTNHSESFCYFHLLIFSSLIYCYTYSYLLLHLHLASCLQCFDIVGWAAGRASGL